jgi:hypothetical protein
MPMKAFVKLLHQMRTFSALVGSCES